RQASAPINWKASACICSNASKAIISPSSACRCCPCWRFSAASGCSASEISVWERNSMRILGLTGSIGMGKSTTAKLFMEAGVPVYDADAAVHKIYEGEAAPAIEAAFPGTTVDGRVDRAKLSAKVVHDQAAIKQLEQIVHPMLGASRKKFLDDAEASGAPVVVMDIPLLFETGGEKRVDAVVVVSTDSATQRERILP